MISNILFLSLTYFANMSKITCPHLSINQKTQLIYNSRVTILIMLIYFTVPVSSRLANVRLRTAFVKQPSTSSSAHGTATLLSPGHQFPPPLHFPPPSSPNLLRNLPIPLATPL